MGLIPAGMDTEQDINSLEKIVIAGDWKERGNLNLFYEITTPVPSKAKESSVLLVMISQKVTSGQSLKFILRMT